MMKKMVEDADVKTITTVTIISIMTIVAVAVTEASGTVIDIIDKSYIKIKKREICNK